MNRIVLIGNGFDRAHGLETSYGHFIDWLWRDIAKHIGTSDIFTNVIKLPNTSFNQEDFEKEKGNIKKSQNYLSFQQSLNSINLTVGFKNTFLELITKKRHENWVDIENTYYQILLKLIDTKSHHPEIGTFKVIAGDKGHVNFGNYDIKRLNEDFKQVRDKLVEYLDNEIDKKPDLIEEISDHIFSTIDFDDFSNNVLKDQIDVLHEKLQNIDLRKLEQKESLELEKLRIEGFTKENIEENLLDINDEFSLILDKKPKEITFVNFNYTNTIENYLNEELKNEFDIINNQIHGSLSKIETNPIIFGFGDEIDDNYSVLENINDNKFLDNVKSIEYLQTNNYKNLLNYIESDVYQIFIMGHSCGLSDRTLLNTLFEHKNCVSIKPFYHKKDGTDNYKDIVQNISRNFKNKVKMRDVVVNKGSCKPLT